MLPSWCYALFLCQISRVKMYPMIIIYLVREKEWGKPIMRNRCSIIAFRRKGVKWCVLQKWDVGLQYGVIGPHWSRTTSFALPLDIDTVAYMQINTIKQQRKHTSQQYWQQTKHSHCQKSFPLEIVLFLSLRQSRFKLKEGNLLQSSQLNKLKIYFVMSHSLDKRRYWYHQVPALSNIMFQNHKLTPKMHFKAL